MKREVMKTNCTLKDICSQYNNVSFGESSKAEKNHHTKLGMHLKMKGKLWLAEQIIKPTVDVLRNTEGLQPSPRGTATHLEHGQSTENTNSQTFLEVKQ